MEAVKRAKPVQKKIVHNILPVLGANTGAFSIRRVKELTVGEYLSPGCFLLGLLEAFSYIALGEIIRNYTLAYPLRPCSKVKGGLEEYLEIRKQKGGNSS
jgi:hypothetical protein